MPERPFPLITEDFLGFKSSMHTWKPLYTLGSEMGWNRSSWVFWEFFRSNHLFNQPYLRRTVGHNHILLFFLPWWDPRSTDSGPCYAILFPFYKCDGPPLPLSTSPTTTLQTNPWFHGKTPQIEGYMDPGVTLCLMEFTGNSKLEWLYFQPFLWNPPHLCDRPIRKYGLTKYIIVLYLNVS